MTKPAKSIKIIARGGLGNQLFQFGAAFHLSHKTNLPITVDSVLVSSNARFNKGLDRRSIELNSFENELIFLPEKSKISSHLQSRMLGISRILGDRYPSLLLKFGSYSNEFVDHIEKFHEINTAVSLNSYCSTPEYFSDCGSQIVNQISQVKNPTEWYHFWSDKIKSEHAIGLNLRLGDYRNLQEIYGGVDPDYYFEAVKLLNKLIGEKPIWIFSDEPELAQKILESKFGSLNFVPHPNVKKPIEYLNVLSQCSAIVCANSSFSWWAGYLATQKSPEVRIVFPRPMFKTQKFREPFNWLPRSWITMGRSL